RNNISNTNTKKEFLTDYTLLALFGYAQNSREDYLFLNLLRSVLEIEIKESHSLDYFLSSESKFSKLFKIYCNLDKDIKYITGIFSPIIKRFLSKNVENFELDPLAIYRNLIKESEKMTGKPSPKPLDISRDLALADPETRPIFIENLVCLRELTNEFMDVILSSLDSMPYGIRYLASQLLHFLSEKLPHKSESELLSTICSIVFSNYFFPYISSPSDHNIADSHSISKHHKKILELSAEILLNISSGTQFSSNDIFLQPLNNFVKFSSARFLEYSYSFTKIISIESHYQIDEFSDFINVDTLALHVSVEDLLNIHYSISSNIEYVAPKLSVDIKEIAQGNEALQKWLRKSGRRNSLRKYSSTYFSESSAALPLASIASIPNSTESSNALDNIIDLLPPGTVLVEREDEHNPNNTSIVLDDPLLVISRELGPPPRLRNDPYANSIITLNLSDRFAYDSMSFMNSSTAPNSSSSAYSTSVLNINNSPSKLISSSLANSADSRTNDIFNLKSDKSSAMHNLFLKAKRMWIAILRVQSGNSLLEILKSPVSHEDEERWNFVVQDEVFKIEQRRKYLQSTWDAQQIAQQQFSASSASSTANAGFKGADNLLKAATKIPDLPKVMPPIPGEAIVREFQNMTFTQLKLAVMSAMQTLEISNWVEKPRRSAIGGAKMSRQPNKSNHYYVFKIRAADNYQGMLNAIARDLKTKSSRREERRAELRKIRQTLISLEQKSISLEKQKLIFEQYLTSCVEKLTYNNSKPSGFGSTKLGSKLSSTGKFLKRKIFKSSSNASASSFNIAGFADATGGKFNGGDTKSNYRNSVAGVPKFGSFKYNAEKLYLKGVLISVEGFSPRQLDKISLSISCDEPGVFDLQLFLMGNPMMNNGGKAELTLDELYEKEYSNITVITLFDNKVKLNVNLLSFLINKKFFR
ncbi:Ras GTPase-activating-like protein IQGAP1, partial [Smittium culicis]